MTQLLTNDAHTLFVVPCGESIKRNKKFRLYCCPGRYGRSNAKYIGFYDQKSVRVIGEVVRVVSCAVGVETQTVTVVNGLTRLSEDEEKRILGATVATRVEDQVNVSSGHDFYLCGGLEETDFRKVSPGGIQSRRYLDLKEILGAKMPNDLGDLALQLRQHSWK